jgi:hypothetical protein
MRVDGLDPRGLCSVSGVDPLDARMGVWRTNEHGMQEAGQSQVIRELSFALDQAIIFQPADGLTRSKLHE